MKQVEFYKTVKNLLESAKASSMNIYWEVEIEGEPYYFDTLHNLMVVLSNQTGYSWRLGQGYFDDSVRVLGKAMPIGESCFTSIRYNEPKARAERLEHLEKLIKLYEDGN